MVILILLQKYNFFYFAEVPTSSNNSFDELYNNEYEARTKALEIERTSLIKELRNLYQLYDKMKNDAIKQKREIQILKDFYTEQCTALKEAEIHYFSRILNLFEDLSNSNGINQFKKQNISSMSIEEIKNDLDQKINYLLSDYKSLLLNNFEHKHNSILNDIAFVISNFQKQFSLLFNNIGDDDMKIAIQDKSINNPFVKNMISFLDDLYTRIKEIINSKIELNEELVSIKNKYNKYSKLQTELCQVINEDNYSNPHLKKLAKQISEELDEIQEAIYYRSNPNSRKTSVSFMNNSPVTVLLLILLLELKIYF